MDFIIICAAVIICSIGVIISAYIKIMENSND